MTLNYFVFLKFQAYFYDKIYCNLMSSKCIGQIVVQDQSSRFWLAKLVKVDVLKLYSYE